MLRLRRPTDGELARELAEQAAQPFSYDAVGASRGTPPPGYAVDHDRVALGTGAEAFRRACAAVRRWAMFQLGWVELYPAAPPIQVGTTVVVLVRQLGLWSLNACRVVYLVEETGRLERFGFAYGTLPGHAAAGEERFTVEWSHDDDRVVYDRFAFSRPRHPLARAAYPLARGLQRRFGADSQRAMIAAVRG